jgi:hypothetical protein
MDILEPILRWAGTNTALQQIRDMPSATAPAFGLKVISGERGKIGESAHVLDCLAHQISKLQSADCGQE